MQVWWRPGPYMRCDMARERRATRPALVFPVRAPKAWLMEVLRWSLLRTVPPAAQRPWRASVVQAERWKRGRALMIEQRFFRSRALVREVGPTQLVGRRHMSTPKYLKVLTQSIGRSPASSSARWACRGAGRAASNATPLLVFRKLSFGPKDLSNRTEAATAAAISDHDSQRARRSSSTV